MNTLHVACEHGQGSKKADPERGTPQEIEIFYLDDRASGKRQLVKAATKDPVIRLSLGRF